MPKYGYYLAQAVKDGYLVDHTSVESEYRTNTNLDSRQIYFVNQIVEYIVHNGMLKDFSVFQESPFTDHGSITEIFTDMEIWNGIKGAIERVNSNVAA